MKNSLRNRSNPGQSDRSVNDGLRIKTAVIRCRINFRTQMAKEGLFSDRLRDRLLSSFCGPMYRSVTVTVYGPYGTVFLGIFFLSLIREEIYSMLIPGLKLIKDRRDVMLFTKTHDKT